MYTPDGCRCDLCGEPLPREPGTLSRCAAALDAGWLWFTGDGDATFHACPGCQARHARRISDERVARGLGRLL